jgi:glutathione S-transferase
MALHLISFKTCPFVQRAVITLKHKDIDFDITYIDLADPPDWFLEMSPLKKVPVLKVDDEILFESAVINEYLDEITGGDLQPKDPLARAKNRAWIEFASNMLGNLYMMKMSKDEERYTKYRQALVSQLQRVEKRLGDGPWFNGEDFSLADTAFAPIWSRMASCR